MGGDLESEHEALNVSSSLLQFLFKERYGEKDSEPKERRKKVNVKAGESICLEEVVQMEEKEEEEERKTKQANKLLCPKLMSVRFQG